MKIFEFVIVAVLMLIPQFMLAAEVDGDEYLKGTSGIVLAGTVLGAYKVWKMYEHKKGVDCGREQSEGSQESD